MSQQVIVGIDGGGTYTRVIAVNKDGKILSFVKGGGVHPEKNKDPKKNVQQAINKALNKARIPLDSVVHIVAGYAGLNNKSDKVWAEPMLQISGLNATTTIVNDAEIAQYGAFLGKRGIIAVAGTGTNVLGKIESGEIYTNRQFHYYAESSARFLTYSVIYDLITKKLSSDNTSLIEKVLAYWNLHRLDELRKLASSSFTGYELNGLKELSNMASIVTEEAENGDVIAIRACKRAAESLSLAIQLVGSMFESNEVPLSFIGGVANTEVIKRLLLKELDKNDLYQTFTYQEPILPPVLGAVLYAFNERNISVKHELIERWKAFKAE